MLVFFLITGWLLFFSSHSLWAAKKRPPRHPLTNSGITQTYSRGARAAIKFRPDRLGLIINFASFGKAVSATYTLTYQSNGIPQGAIGTAKPNNAGQPRELLFGTCSGGICRWHTNITSARLTIDSKLSSGLVIRKPYRIKI